MTDCSICLNHDSELDITLDCGHIFHQKCISKHFKQECALCRAPHNLEITGSRPSDVFDALGDISKEGKKETLSSIYKRMLAERKAEYDKIKNDLAGSEADESVGTDLEDELSDYADHDALSESEDYDY
jgi:hypothetical protein